MNNSLIPESLTATLTDLANAWQNVQLAKANVNLQRAKNSLTQLGDPNVPSDPQAKTGTSSSQQPAVSSTVLIGAALVGLVALVLIVKD